MFTIAGVTIFELIGVGLAGAAFGYVCEKVMIKLNKENFDAEFDKNWNAFEEKRNAMGFSDDDFF